MEGRIAVKRLAAVEVSPDRSNQHEFNAGRLRTELGFGRERVTGPLHVVLLGPQGEEPRVDDGTFTLYDARESHPTRSEHRLYYDSPLIAGGAASGDLLVLFRAPGSNALRAMIARRGSPSEGELLEALLIRDDKTLETFQFAGPSSPTASHAAGMLDVLVGRPDRAPGVRDHPLFMAAAESGLYPDTRAMAKAARELVGEAEGAALDPDSYLAATLAAETDLYFAIEEQIDGARLKTVVQDDRGLSAVLDFAMRIQQSRKSRRGLSLQNHFAALLDRASIPYTAQCGTEEGETPDFLVPSCGLYHDAGFPAAKLRMVACKSTAKERWRQVLNEAQRIDEKYLLTLDTELTDDVVRAMRTARLRPFVPAGLARDRYDERPIRSLLGTVADLLDELQDSLGA